LIESTQSDHALLKQINQSGADLLLVGLGNPKQELWFNRNRRYLKVPVAIGVGGTFEFITGGVRRAPLWLQRLNLEWLYRVSQDPGRLWRRYAKGLVKMVLLGTPLIYARCTQQLAITFAGEQPVPNWRRLWSSRQQSLRILSMPRYVSAQALRAVTAGLDTAPSSAALSIIDFSQTRRVEMAGQEVFFTLAEMQRGSAGRLQLLGMLPQLKQQLATGRVLDLVGDSGASTLTSLEPASVSNAGLQCSSYVLDDTTLVFLNGLLDAEGLAGIGVVESLLGIVRHRRCLLDLRGITLLESSAIVALLPLLEMAGGRLLISGASVNTRRMFTHAQLGVQVIFINDAELLSAITGEEANA
jgi:N-acetylglucosaminyldiphosphoundecaprenol N-acetyl-beta-D-mannosaminyltransferase